MGIIESTIFSILLILVILAPIPVTISFIYLNNLSKEQGGKAWLLHMLSRGAMIKTISTYIIAFLALYSIGRLFFGWGPLPPGVGTILLGIVLLGVEMVTVYQAYVIRDKRKTAIEQVLKPSTSELGSINHKDDIEA